MSCGHPILRAGCATDHAKPAELGPGAEVTRFPHSDCHVCHKYSLTTIFSIALAGVVNRRDLVFSADKVHGEVQRAANMVQDIEGA